MLNCYYKVFKDEPVVMFSGREMLRYYCSRLCQLLSLSVTTDTMTSKEQEAALPPVSHPLCILVVTYLISTLAVCCAV